MDKKHENSIPQSWLWQAPEEYVLDSLIATTMLLDVSSAIRTLLQSQSPGQEWLSKGEMSAYLASLAEGGRCHFFYDKQKGIQAAGGHPQFIRAVLEMCHPVRHSHVFHPKIILARFRPRSGAGDCCYHLQVSSKNLTEADAFEVCAQLYTQPGLPNHNLPDLLQFLSNQANSSEFSEIALDMIRDLKSLQFVTEGAKNVEVIVSGINGITQKSLLKNLGCEQGERLPISLPKDRNMIILSPDYETAQDKLEGFPVYAPREVATHAKLYCDLKKKTVWLGSSNLSDNGMAGNVECMVRFQPVSGAFPAEHIGQNVQVFGIPCSRTTVSCIPKGKLAAETALSQFIQNHNFSMIENRTSDGKLQVKVKVSLTGQEEIFPEILPYGMAEQMTTGASRWKTLVPTGTSFKFKGSKKDSICQGILRIRYQSVERLILAKSNQRCVVQKLLEESIQDFVGRDWFRALCHEETREKAYQEAVNIGNVLLNCTSQAKNLPLLQRHLRYIDWYAGRFVLTPETDQAVCPASQVLPVTPLSSTTSTVATTFTNPKFQQDAIQAALDAFINCKRTRYLVADETGLGKTHIARGIIEKLYDAHKKQSLQYPFVVYYFGSNIYLLEDTLNKLIGNNKDYKTFPDIDRLGIVVPKWQLGEIQLSPNHINLLGVSANLLDDTRSSEGNIKERNLYVQYLLSKKSNTAGMSPSFSKIREDFVKVLPQIDGQYMLKDEDDKEKLRNSISEIREHFVRVALQGISTQCNGQQVSLVPKLIVVDEFHRYHEILTNVLGPLQQSSKVPMLMLSATPYVMYAGDVSIDSDIAENENVKAEQGFKTFTDVLSFLEQGDPAKPQLVKAYCDEWNSAQPDLDSLSLTLKGYVWRNERIGSVGNKYRDLPQEQTWLSGRYDNCIPGALNVFEPKRYFSLCPGPFSFPYRFRTDEFYQELNLVERESNGGLETQHFLFNRDEQLRKELIDSFLPLRLIQDAVADPGRQLLWVPPSQPLFRVEGKIIPSDFTKLLVFSGYHMVPRMLSAVFSDMICPHSIKNPPKLKITSWNNMDENLVKSLAEAYTPSPSQSSVSVEEILAELQNCWAITSCWQNLGATKEYWALYAMGSPLVCAYRLTGDIETASKISAAFQSYFQRDEIAYVLQQAGVTDEAQLLRYCVDYQLQAVLWEYQFCVGNQVLSNLKNVLSPSETSVKVAVPKGCGGWTEISVPCHFAQRFSPDVGDTGASGSSKKGKENQACIQQAFNSPFWPMMLITTSMGQEGVDLDQYCSRIMHYSLPSNPMSFEQRDGRVERRRSLLARRIMVEQYGAPIGITFDRFWEWLFAQGSDASGMIPDWVQNSDSDRWKLERIIPFFPLSREYEMYQQLLRWKNFYRKKMGIPIEQVGLNQSNFYLKLNNL